MQRSVRSSSRQQYTASQKQRFVRSFRKSGLTQKAFSKRERISVGTLRNWLYKRRPKSRVRETVPLVQVSLPPAGRGPKGFEIRLPNGRRLGVPPGFDGGEVRALLSILEDAC